MRSDIALSNPLVRIALTFVFAALLVTGSEWVGVSRGLDDMLSRSWVQLRAGLGVGADDEQSVVVVAIDEQTIEQWGHGPWSDAMRDELLAQIDAGEPRFVAQVGHGQPFQSTAVSSLFSHPRGTAWDIGGFEHGQLVDPYGSFSRLAALMGVTTEPGTVPVHWRPAASIPVVSALAVARGEIDAERFAARGVLIGFDLPTYTTSVATPLGPLSPTLVEAHALHGLTQVPTPPARPQGWRLGLGLVLALLTVPLVYVAYSWRATVVLVASLLGSILALDLIGAQLGWLDMGTGLSLVVLGSIVAVHWGLEFACMQHGLHTLQHSVLDDRWRNAGDAEAALDRDAHDLEFWDDLARLAATFIHTLEPDARSTIYARESDSTRLRGHTGTGDAVAKANLHRAPFRAAWQSLAPCEHGELLVIPLRSEDRCLGMWQLALSQPLSPELRVRVEQYAAQLSRSAACRGAQRLVSAGAQDSVRAQIDLIANGIEIAQHHQHAALELLEHFPVSVAIATAWGETQFISEELQAQLDARGLSGLDRTPDLFMLLSSLTDNDAGMCRRMMGRVAVTGLTLELGADDEGDNMWMLSRVSTEASDYLVLSSRPMPEIQHTPRSDLDLLRATPITRRRRAAR